MLSQEMFTVQDPSSPPSDILLWTPLECLYRTNVRIQDLPQRGFRTQQVLTDTCPVNLWVFNFVETHRETDLFLASSGVQLV